MTTNETNTAVNVSFSPVAKDLARAIVVGERQPEEILATVAQSNGADELRVPSDLENYGQVPASVSYTNDNGDQVRCTVVADRQPMAKAVNALKLDAEISEARAAETASAAKQSKPKRQPKPQRLKTHFATKYQTKACAVLVFGSEQAREAMAKFIVERADSLKAKVVVVPAQVADDKAAQSALVKAGLNSPESGDLPKWSVDPKHVAEEPERKSKKGKRGNGHRPQKRQGYVQPGTGKSANPYAGMKPSVAKWFSPEEAANLKPAQAEKEAAKRAAAAANK